MLNFLKKFLVGVTVFAMTAMPAMAQNIVTSSGVFRVDNGTIKTNPANLNLEIGGNVTVNGNLVVSGIQLSADMDTDGFDIIFDQDGDSAFRFDRDAGVADDEFEIDLGGFTTLVKTNSSDLIFKASVNNAGIAIEDDGSTNRARLYQAANFVITAGTGSVNFSTPINGGLVYSQSNGITSTAEMVDFSAGAHTGLTASTEQIDVKFDLSNTKQFNQGALTTQRDFQILARTYDFGGASTVTDAATLYIDNAPREGTNATITDAYSLWVDDGLTRLDGQVRMEGASGTNPRSLVFEDKVNNQEILSFQAWANGATSNYAFYNLNRIFDGTDWQQMDDTGQGFSIQLREAGTDSGLALYEFPSGTTTQNLVFNIDEDGVMKLVEPGGGEITMEHNGTNMVVATSSGDIIFVPTSGSADVFVGDASNSNFTTNVNVAVGGNASYNFLENGTTTNSLRAKYGTEEFVVTVDGASGGQVLITDADNIGKDHDIATQTDPMLCVFSSTDPDTNNTQKGCFQHDQTDFVYSVGSGLHAFQGVSIGDGQAADGAGVGIFEATINDTTTADGTAGTFSGLIVEVDETDSSAFDTVNAIDLTDGTNTYWAVETNGRQLFFDASDTFEMGTDGSGNFDFKFETGDGVVTFEEAESLLVTNVTTDASNKAARYGVPHHTNSEEPFYGFLMVSGTTTSTMQIGGGSTLGNAATAIEFYIAANNTTTQGEKILEMDTSEPSANTADNNSNADNLFFRVPDGGTDADSSGGNNGANVQFTLGAGSAAAGSSGLNGGDSGDFILVLASGGAGDGAGDQGDQGDFLIKDDSGNEQYKVNPQGEVSQFNQTGVHKTTTGSLQTTNATPANVMTLRTENDSGHMVTTNCSAIKSDGSEVGGYVIHGVFKNDGGTLTQVGTTTSAHTSEDDATWDLDYAISGTDIAVEATGAAETIDWFCGAENAQVSLDP